MTNIDVVEIGKRIRASREAKGLTRRAVADLTDIPYRTMENFELGTQEPSVSRMRVLAETLGVTEGFLIDGTTESGTADEDDLPWDVDDPEDDSTSDLTNLQIEDVRSRLSDLDAEADSGFGSNTHHVSTLIDQLTTDLRRLDAGELIDLARERDLRNIPTNWAERIAAGAEDESEGIIADAETITERIIDTAVFGNDLHAFDDDALIALGEAVGLNFSAGFGSFLLGLSDSERERIVFLLRPPLRATVLAGIGPSLSEHHSNGE